MSSAVRPSVLKSSSLRLAVLLMLVIWIISAGIIIAVVAASERALLRPLNDSVVGEIEIFLEQLESSEFEYFEWYEDELEALFVETDDLDEDDPEAFRERYIERLREDDGGSARRRASVQIRLWLLRAEDTLDDVDRPLEYYTHLMFEEVPEH